MLEKPLRKSPKRDYDRRSGVLIFVRKPHYEQRDRRDYHYDGRQDSDPRGMDDRDRHRVGARDRDVSKSSETKFFRSGKQRTPVCC